MYESFYQLSDNPFRLAPDPRFCFSHPSYDEAQAYLDYALHLGEGFVLFTGRPGTGKTTLIQTFLNRLDLTKVLATRIAVTHPNTLDLLRSVAYAFDIDVQGLDMATILRRIEQFLIQQSRSARRALLIIDEAQGLSHNAIEELRLLADLQNESRYLLQIFLVGQESLRDLMAVPEMEQFQQRVAGTCRVQPLGLQDTRDYIEYRLRQVDWRGDPAFTGAAVHTIYLYSKGIPRHINKLCTRLMLHGMLEVRHEINRVDVLDVATGLREEQLAPLDSDENAVDDLTAVDDSTLVRDIAGGAALLNDLAIRSTEEDRKPPRAAWRLVDVVHPEAGDHHVIENVEIPVARREAVSRDSPYHHLASDLRALGADIEAFARDLFHRGWRSAQVLLERFKTNEQATTMLVGFSAVTLLLLVLLTGSEEPDNPDTPGGLEISSPGRLNELPLASGDRKDILASATAPEVSKSAAGVTAAGSESEPPQAVMVEPINEAEPVEREPVSLVEIEIETDAEPDSPVAATDFAAAERETLPPGPVVVPGSGEGETPGSGQPDKVTIATVSSHTPEITEDRTEVPGAAPAAVEPQSLEEPVKVEEAADKVAHDHRLDSTVAAADAVPPGVEVVNEVPGVSREQQHIAAFLAQARERLREDRLLFPEGDSAYHYFGHVLLLDPANQAAYDGLKQIAARYLLLSQGALDRQDEDKARRYINRGLRIQPKHRQLLALRTRLDSPAVVAPVQAPKPKPIAAPAPVAPVSVAPSQPEPQDFFSRLKAMFERASAGDAGTQSIWEDDEY